MERKEGLNTEELEAQETGLLPDRVEMRRRRRIVVTQISANYNENTNVAFANSGCIFVGGDEVV